MVATNSDLKPHQQQGLEGRKGMPRQLLAFQHPRLVDKPQIGPGWIHEV
jgi:hypothetical protein